MNTLRSVFLMMLTASLLASPAHGDDTGEHSDTKNRYTIRAPEPFVFAAKGELLGRYQGERNMKMSVSRISYPSLPAWRKDQREAFVDQLVSGARKSTRGYRHKSQKAHRIGGVPGLDLHFARTGSDGQELVWMRFLFFRRYVIVASASTSSRSEHKRAKAFAGGLAPLRDPRR
jgi:hypothetical protein